MAYGPVSAPGRLTAEDVGAVPVTRKVNGKALSADISLAASDVEAAPSNHTHNYMSATNPRFTGELSSSSGCLVMGYSCKVKNGLGIAVGSLLEAGAVNQIVFGRMNKTSESLADKLIIGGRNDGDGLASRFNCFRVNNGGVYASGSYNSTGADYAELFEWLDGNPDVQDRVGRFVTLDGEKIRLANPDDDFILGIVSGNPSIVGDVHDDQWKGIHLHDIYGRPLWEDVEVPDEIVEEPDPENPEQTVTRIIFPAHIAHRRKPNPNYDDAQEYIPRTERPEWGCVGMMGKLVVIDDGTCPVNGWAKPGVNGIATASESRTKYRVMSRLDDTHIRVLIL